MNGIHYTYMMHVKHATWLEYNADQKHAAKHYRRATCILFAERNVSV